MPEHTARSLSPQQGEGWGEGWAKPVDARCCHCLTLGRRLLGERPQRVSGPTPSRHREPGVCS
jgi:hypothetical protein